MGIYKRSKVYWISYYYQGTQIRESVGTSKKDAEKALLIRRSEIFQGRFDLKKVKSSPLFEDFCLDYLEYAKANKKSWERDDRIIKNFLPRFKNKKLNEITEWSIEKYKITRKKKDTPATVNRELACLKHIFNKAIEWGKALSNPVRQVKLYKIEETRLRYLSEEKISILISACHGHLRDVVITALNTGMRAQEIFTLSWRNIDLKHRFITVEKTKSKKIRKIPINDILLEVLKERKKTITGHYLFPNHKGDPIGSVKTSFKSALVRAGIKNFRFHDLRHTFASHLVLNGVDLVTVKELLGHSSIQLTMRYAHLPERHKMDAVNLLKFQNNHNLITIDKLEKTKNLQKP